MFSVIVDIQRKYHRNIFILEMQEPHTYIRLAISTKKFMEMARKEIQNILPLLSRHFGRLIVSVNQKKRSVFVGCVCMCECVWCMRVCECVCVCARAEYFNDQGLFD